MASFRFRLAKVLEWYTRQYELEERRLHECLGALQQAQQAIAAFEAERLAVEHDVLSRTAIPARELVALGSYRLGARQRAVDLDGIQDKCRIEVEAQRARLQVAQRKMRLLEKLRERRVAEFVQAESRELEELAADAFFAKWAARG